MANLGYVSTFNINGNELTLKDAALTEIVSEIIEAIGANNTNIAERINDLHNRSFDNTIKISSQNESEIASIQDGLYKIQYVTVTGEGEQQTETLNDSAILIQKGTNQYLYKDGIISSRTKENNTWGTWTNMDSDHPIKEFTSNTDTDQIEGTLYDEPDGYYLISWRWTADGRTSTYGPELLRKKDDTICSLVDTTYSIDENILFYYDVDNNIYNVINFDNLEIKSANTETTYETHNLLSPLPASYKSVYDMLCDLGLIQVSETYDEETEKTTYSISLPSDNIVHPIVLAVKDYENYSEEDQQQDDPNYGLYESLINLDFVKPVGDASYVMPDWIGTVGKTEIACLFGLIPHEQYESNIYPDRTICDIGLIEVKTVSKQSNFMYQYDYNVEVTEYLLLERKKRTINYLWVNTGGINAFDFRNVEWTDYDYFLKNVNYPVTSVNGQTGAVTITIPDAQIQADWNQTTTTAKDYIKNKPTIPTVPTTSTTVTANDNNPVSGGAVYAKLEDLIGSAPAALDTLGEIAAALNNDADLAGTLTNQITGKISKVSPATAGNFAALNSDGTLSDSGHKHSDYLTSETQADWNETNTSSAAYINNKPTIPTVPTNISAFTNDSGYITASSLVQSDWNQTDTTANDYIKNKPDIRTNSGQTYIGENSYVHIGMSSSSPSSILVDNTNIHFISGQIDNGNAYTNLYIEPTHQSSHFTNAYNGYIIQITKKTSTIQATGGLNQIKHRISSPDSSYLNMTIDEYGDSNLSNSYIAFNFEHADTSNASNKYANYKFDLSYFTLRTEAANTSSAGELHISSYEYPSGSYWMSINGERVPKLSDIQTSLSSNYTTSTDTNDDLLLASGDTYEEAFGKLEKAILDNSEVTATAIQEVASNSATAIQEVASNMVTSVNGQTGDVTITIPESQLSNDYAMSTATNDDLELASGDTYETAFGKLEKAIIDNELVVTAAITDLDSRVTDTESLATVAKSGSYNDLTNRPTIPSKTSDLTNDSGFITSAPVTSVNGQQGAVTLSLGQTNVIETVKVNNTALTPDANKAVNITVPTKTSDLTNDSGFITNAPVTSVNSKTGAVTVKENVQSDWNATTGDAVILNKPTIPAAVTESTVAGWGFTKNTGTLTTETQLSKGTATGTGNAVTDINVSNHQITLVKGKTFLETAPVTSVNGATGDVTLALGDTNVIETVKVNNTALTPVSKAVNITVPTKTSDLTNDSGFLTQAPVTSVNGATGAVTVKANVQSDWNATSGDAVILNKPTIPTVNDSTVTITMNGNTVGTFTLNKSGNTTIDLGTVLTSHQSIKTINNQTITGTGNVNISGLPTVTSADNGKVLMVVDGTWQLVSPVSLYSGSSAPSNSQGNNGDIYVQS